MVDCRTVTKLIRLHPEELRQITESARRSGVTPARFIRETALGATPRARSHAATGPLFHELARIGRSLDQLARFARASQDPALTAQTSAALELQQVASRWCARCTGTSGRCGIGLPRWSTASSSTLLSWGVAWRRCAV